MKFHDGTSFDADDVAATLRTVLSPRNATTAMRSYLDGLETVEVVDARTVMVRWSRASHEGFRTVALAMPILPAEALKEDFNTSAILRRPIGTGPLPLRRLGRGRGADAPPQRGLLARAGLPGSGGDPLRPRRDAGRTALRAGRLRSHDRDPAGPVAGDGVAGLGARLPADAGAREHLLLPRLERAAPAARRRAGATCAGHALPGPGGRKVGGSGPGAADALPLLPGVTRLRSRAAALAPCTGSRRGPC